MPTVNDIVVRKPSEQESQLSQTWPIWTCETSEFEWEYTQTEKCLIITGNVEITDVPPSGSKVSLSPGDFVVLPDGLKCVWKVTQPVKKYYDFE